MWNNVVSLSTEQDYYNPDTQEFFYNFVGSRNAIDIKETKNFEVIIEQRKVTFK